MLLSILQTHRTISHNKEFPAPEVNSAEVKKYGFRGSAAFVLCSHTDTMSLCVCVCICVWICVVCVCCVSVCCVGGEGNVCRVNVFFFYHPHTYWVSRLLFLQLNIVLIRVSEVNTLPIESSSPNGNFWLPSGKELQMFMWKRWFQ